MAVKVLLIRLGAQRDLARVGRHCGKQDLKSRLALKHLW